VVIENEKVRHFCNDKKMKEVRHFCNDRKIKKYVITSETKQSKLTI
jgi:hypothetical protein